MSGNKEKLRYMLLRKGFKDPEHFSFYYDNKRRTWLVAYKDSHPQIVGSNIMEVAFKIGDGFFNNVYSKLLNEQG